MPGIASITLTCSPFVGDLDENIMRRFQQELDQQVPRAIEREWETLICSDDPTWEDIIARLDNRIATTPMGNRVAGAITPDPTPVDVSKWNWTALVHEGPRVLFDGNAQWTINVDGTYDAFVMARYRYRSAPVLPA